MKVWTVSEAKIGTLSQCVSVAKRFASDPVEKTFVPNRGWRRVFDRPLFRLTEAEPELIVSCGFRSEKRVLKINRNFGYRPFKVHLQHPLNGGYDLVFVSRHDWQPEFDQHSNYHQMVGVPHRFAVGFWESRRSSARAAQAAGFEKVVAVFLGGANGAYAYDDASHKYIVETIQGLANSGWRVLVSVSRRSSAETHSLMLALSSEAIAVWDRRSANPYIEYMAAADAFLIAKDSVTMPCEALSTGRPVYSLDLSSLPGNRHEKFERFHYDLQFNLRLTRHFEGNLIAYDYNPPDETTRIGEIIRAKLDLARSKPRP